MPVILDYCRDIIPQTVIPRLVKHARPEFYRKNAMDIELSISIRHRGFLPNKILFLRIFDATALPKHQKLCIYKYLSYMPAVRYKYL